MPLFFLLLVFLSSMHVHAGLGVPDTNTHKKSLLQSLVDTGRIQASSNPKDYIRWLQARSEDELEDEIENIQLALDDLTGAGRLEASAAIALTAFLAVMLMAVIDSRLFFVFNQSPWHHVDGQWDFDHNDDASCDMNFSSNDLHNYFAIIKSGNYDLSSQEVMKNAFYFHLHLGHLIRSAQWVGYFAALAFGGLNYFPLDIPPLRPHDLIAPALKSIAFNLGLSLLLSVPNSFRYSARSSELVSYKLLFIHLPYVVYELVYYLLSTRDERKGEVQDLKYQLKQVRRVLKNKKWLVK